MPRYFFDLQDHEVLLDDEGAELPSEEEASVQAVTFAGEYLRDHPNVVWDGHEIRVHVFDEAREPIFLVAMFGVDPRRKGDTRP